MNSQTLNKQDRRLSRQHSVTVPHPIFNRNNVLMAALALCLAASLNAVAQTAAGTNAIDPVVLTKLLQRIDELELKSKKVDDLEAQVKTLKANTPTNAAPAAVATFAPAVQDTTITRSIWPNVTFNVQGDVDFYYSKGPNSANQHNTFFLGDLDPLVVAKLSDKASVLGDFAITSDNDQGDGFNFDIERLYAEYNISDYFNIQAGRFDTSIGYYNNAFHNGSYFQTTTDRPIIYQYEDGGGILPVHSTGLTLFGEIPSGSWNLHYVAQVLNGRNYDVNHPVFYVSDNNDFKALNLELFMKPEWAPHWQMGASAYYDKVNTPTLSPIDQLILTGYGVYRTPLLEWMTEGIFIRQGAVDGPHYWTPAGYSEISRKFGKLRPYARLDWQLGQPEDPLLRYIGANYGTWGPTVGLRYDFTPMMAVKVELDHEFQDGMKSLNELVLQWTFRY